MVTKSTQYLLTHNTYLSSEWPQRPFKRLICLYLWSLTFATPTRWGAALLDSLKKKPQSQKIGIFSKVWNLYSLYLQLYYKCIIYNTSCLCFHEDIWKLDFHRLKCFGTMPSLSPVPPSTDFQGQCALKTMHRLEIQPTTGSLKNKCCPLVLGF